MLVREGAQGRPEREEEVDPALKEFVSACARQLQDTCLDGTDSGYMTARGMEVLGLEPSGASAVESKVLDDAVTGRYWLMTGQHLMEAWRLHCGTSLAGLLDNLWAGLSAVLGGEEEEEKVYSF